MRTVRLSKVRLLLVAALFLCALPATGSATGPKDPLKLMSSTWGIVAAQVDVDPYLLYAIALKEAGRQSSVDGLVYPQPYIVTGHKLLILEDHQEKTLKRLQKAVAKGRTNMNLGVMQINWRWHKQRVQSLSELLDFKTNIRVGAQILKEALNSSRDREIGVGRYHTWDTEQARQYGRKILQITANLRALPEKGGK